VSLTATDDEIATGMRRLAKTIEQVYQKMPVC
jgi:alanine-alpha-ketoisovalerate/valine-pyruvate aminotransferase